MREFNIVKKTFIKSNNSTIRIFNRYLWCLIPCVLFVVIYNLIWGTNTMVIGLFKSMLISFITCIVTSYIFSLIRKEKGFSKLLFRDNIIAIAIIIGLFSIDASSVLVVIASLVSVIVRKVFKNITISSSLYGILIVLVWSNLIGDVETPLSNLRELSYVGAYDDIVKPYGSILSYLFGLKYYVSPVISIILFVYLFYKKSIKYNIVFSYIFTFSIMMFLFGLFNGMNIWYLFFQLCTGNILFLSVFGLTDYPNTPLTSEGQIIYGIILGLMTSVLRFIVPELAALMPMLIGPVLCTKWIDKISYKLKYNKKLPYMLLVCGAFLIVLIALLIII